MANKTRDFPKKEEKKPEAPAEPLFRTRKFNEQLEKKPEADALKAKAKELAEKYPLNPGGVSGDL
jgi:hypothetical protein